MFVPTFNKINRMITDHCLTIGEQLTKIRTSIMKLSKAIINHHEKLVHMQKQVDLLMDIKNRKESNEPWIDFIGGDIDPQNGLQLNLDWNDAFVDQLRAQGYRGTTETELVSQYLKNVASLVGGQKPEEPDVSVN